MARFMRRSTGLAFTSGKWIRFGAAALLSAGLALAQAPSNGWPRAGESSQANTNEQAPPPNEPPDYPSAQNAPYSPNGGYQQSAPYNQPPSYQPPPEPSGPVPATVTITPGTFLTVRLNQTLSSDHNHAGDAFSASLVAPVIADGVVVAQRGQMLGGRIIEAEKAGRVEGTSKLRIQLTDMTLVDGHQLPVQGQFINWKGGTSKGRDTAAVAGTTGLGAIIGAAAGSGSGAAIGAGAGAAAGIIGVLLTRGRPTVIPAEAVVTFRTQASITVATDRAPQAFHYAGPDDYGQPAAPPQPAYASAPPVPPAPCAGYGCAAPPPPYYYGPAGYYPYWGTSVVVFGRPGYYYRPHYYYGYRGGHYYRGGSYRHHR